MGRHGSLAELCLVGYLDTLNPSARPDRDLLDALQAIMSRDSLACMPQ